MNRLYRMMKSQVARLRGTELTLAERERFYRIAAANVEAALANGQPRQVSLRLGEAITMPGGWSLDCALTYRYEPPPSGSR